MLLAFEFLLIAKSIHGSHECQHDYSGPHTYLGASSGMLVMLMKEIRLKSPLTGCVEGNSIGPIKAKIESSTF